MPSGSRQPPELPPFFLDESLDGDSLASELAGLSITVERFAAHFPKNSQVSDEELWPFLAEKGWVWFTKDWAWRRKPELIAMLKTLRERVIAFHGSSTRAEIVELVRRHRRKLSRLLRKDPPVILRLTRGGDIIEM